MKAVAVYPSARTVRTIERELPAIKRQTDVLLRIRSVGVCGTDREICQFEYGTPPSGSDHLVLGHEAIAEVAAVGAGVTRVRVGDVVVPMVRRPCHHEQCGPCRSGRQDFCTTGEFTERGINGAHGFMTEFVIEDESWLQPVSRAIADVGVLVEPLTIAEKALIQLHHVQERLPWSCRFEPGQQARACHSALVLGAGPVGLLGAMAFSAAGYATTVYSREPEGSEKARIVEGIGARYVSAAAVPVERLAAHIGTVDVVYEAVGASSLAFRAMPALGVNGVFLFTGVPGRKGPIEVDTDRLARDLVLKNQVMLGTVNAGRDAFDAAVRDLEGFAGRWPDAVAALIQRHPLAAAEELLLGPPSGIKNVIDFAR